MARAMKAVAVGDAVLRLYPESLCPHLCELVLGFEPYFEVGILRSDADDFARTCRLWHLALRQRFRFIPREQYRAVLDELAAASGCDLSPAAFRNSFMSWDEARALAADGFEVGGHTRTHPVLTQVESAAELDDEILGARRRLETELGTRVVSLAYPVGGPSAVNGRVVEAARRAGCEFAWAY